MITYTRRLLMFPPLHQNLSGFLSIVPLRFFSKTSSLRMLPNNSNSRNFASASDLEQQEESSENNDQHLVQEFLESFGEGDWGESFTTWEHLLTAKTKEMRDMDIPVKSRKKILRKVEQWKSASRIADEDASIKEHVEIEKIQKIVAEDYGEKGITSLIIEDNLIASAFDLSESEHVVILTGFPISKKVGSEPIWETDGPMGALAIARAITLKSENSVVICTDSLNKELLQQAVMESNIPEDQVSIRTFTPKCRENEFHETVEAADHIVAIGRVGPSADGKCFNVHKEDITEWTAPLDKMITMAREQGCKTTAIGDGGNEIGMGKVYDQVGDDIACVTVCDNLIICGTSNWGGYALAAAMGILDSGKRDNFLPTSDQELVCLRKLVDAGALDSQTKKQSTETIDGVDWKYTASVLDQLQNVLNNYQPFDPTKKMGHPKYTKMYLNQNRAKELLYAKNLTSS